MIRVVTILWGTKYDWEYAERLSRGVAEHLDAPHEFVCYTDHVRQLPHGTARKLPPLRLTSWFWKLWLFSPDMREGPPILWLDLDTVIRGPLDFLVGGDRFLILRDVYVGPRWQSSLMYLPETVGTEVWDAYLSAGRPVRYPRGEQQFTDDHFDKAHPWALIQDEHPGKCVSWKADEVERRGAGDASVIFFHGRPRPHEVGWAEGV